MNPAKPVRQLRPANRANRPLLDQRQPPFDLLDDAKSCGNRAWIDPENSHGRDCNCRARIKGLRFHAEFAERRRKAEGFSAPPRTPRETVTLSIPEPDLENLPPLLAILRLVVRSRRVVGGWDAAFGAE